MQIDPVLLASFALLWLAIVPTPGPNTLLIVHLAVTARWRDVALALGGNLLAMAFYALATLQGLAVLLAAAPSVRLAIYLLGGAYLVWIGVRLVQLGFARRAEASNNATIGGNPDTKAQRPFVQGILTGLANVQALLFLAGIFAGAGLLAASLATRLAAVGIIMAINGGYLGVLAWLLQRERVREVYARYRPAMEIMFGVLFVLFGARLALRELAGWLWPPAQGAM